MSFAPSDHIFLCTVLPTLSSSSSASILNPFLSGPRSPTVGTYSPTSHGSSVDGPQGHSGISTPDDDESKREKDLRILKEIRATAMDRLKEEAMKLKSKGCAITPVIIHVSPPSQHPRVSSKTDERLLICSLSNRQRRSVNWARPTPST